MLVVFKPQAIPSAEENTLSLTVSSCGECAPRAWVSDTSRSQTWEIAMYFAVAKRHDIWRSKKRMLDLRAVMHLEARGFGAKSVLGRVRKVRIRASLSNGRLHS